jgi:hypothetical protein
MTKVKCQKCGNEGYLIAKQTVSKGMKYQYWYVKHNLDDKIKWCYIGKALPAEYQKPKPVGESTQTRTQNSMGPNNLKTSLNSQNRNGNVSASIAQSVEQQPCKLQVAGSIPARGSVHAFWAFGVGNHLVQIVGDFRTLCAPHMIVTVVSFLKRATLCTMAQAAFFGRFFIPVITTSIGQ